MTGKLEMEKVMKDGKPSIRVRVRGNVGQENRDKLDVLGMIPEIDVSNSRSKIVTNAIDLELLRRALIDQQIVVIPPK